MAQGLKIHVNLRGLGFNSQYSCGCSQQNSSTHMAAHNQIPVPTWLPTTFCKFTFQRIQLSLWSPWASGRHVVHRHTYKQNTHIRTWFKKWGHAKEILSAHRKTPRKQDQSLESSISSKPQNCSWNMLQCPPQIQQMGVSLLQVIYYN